MLDESLVFRITCLAGPVLSIQEKNSRLDQDSRRRSNRLSYPDLAQWFVWVDQLVRAPARKAGDPGSNPGPGENFSLKLTKITCLFLLADFVLEAQGPEKKSISALFKHAP